MNDKDSGFKPKKSVALSGVVAGNTALSTVGRTGNDLHYRGYDILDIADRCEFEEIAYLLVHEKLPSAAELAAYKAKLRSMRGIPASVKTVLEALPASAHPMDVMRTGVSALGCVEPEKDDHNVAGARDIADRLMASLGSMLLYWHHFAHSGKRIEVETDDDSIGGHLLHLLHGRPPSEVVSVTATTSFTAATGSPKGWPPRSQSRTSSRARVSGRSRIACEPRDGSLRTSRLPPSFST